VKTEDVKLDIKSIFDKKKIDYSRYDVARMRYLCKTFVEFVVEMEK